MTITGREFGGDLDQILVDVLFTRPEGQDGELYEIFCR